MQQHWNFDTPPKPKMYKTSGDGMGGRKTAGDFFTGEGEETKKIYKTAGDGLGGRAGQRSWGFGDDSDPEVQAEKVRGRRGQAKAGAF